MSPRAIGNWDWREKLLHGLFLILPATQDGQLAAVVALDDPDEEDEKPGYPALLGAWKRRFGQDSAPDDLYNLKSLNAYLGEDMFSWLAAAALYPRPDWEMTIAVSQALHGQPLSFDSLLRLSQVPWLQDGELSAELRSELIDSLNPEQVVAARSAILAVLKATSVDERSFARRERDVQQVVNEAELPPQSPQKRAALRAFYENDMLDPWAAARVEQLKEEQERRITAPIWLALLGAALLAVLGIYTLLDKPGARTVPVWLSGFTDTAIDSAAWFNNEGINRLTAGDSIGASRNWQAAQDYYEQTPGRYDFAFYNLRLLNYRGGKQAYDQESWLTATERFSPIRLGENDSLDLHLLHGRGLSHFYLGDTAVAETLATALPDTFFLAFGEPNLRSELLQADEAARQQIEALIARLRQRADRRLLGEPPADSARAALEDFRRILSYRPNDVPARDGMRRAQDRLTLLAQRETPANLRITFPTGRGCVPLTMEVSATADKAIEAYSWTLPGALPASSSEINPTPVYTVPGVYDITLTADFADGTTETLTLAGAVTTYPLPIADFSFEVDTENPLRIQFENRSTAATSFRWTVALCEAGTSGPDCGTTREGRNPSYTYSEAGTYRVQLVAIGECGNDTLEQDIRVEEPVAAIIPQMQQIPKGTFLMGSEDKEAATDEQPVHEVTIFPFEIGVYEVTVGEYLAFCIATDTHWPEWLEADSEYHVETGSNSFYKERGYSRTGSEQLPIVGVSWNDAIAYCAWLNTRSGKTGWRLPTEAEWEYAAGGGSESRTRYAGTDVEKDLQDYAWYVLNGESRTHPVGTRLSNSLGLYDMSGNVWEWCQDRYGDYPNVAQTNPRGPETGSDRVIRGGSWSSDASNCRVAVRVNVTPVYRLDNVGFRLARSF